MLNVQKFFETLAAIISEREGVKITVTVTRRTDVEEKKEIKTKK